jgi:hypothetical protein
MSPRVHGTLEGADQADTYMLWRRPGPHRFELDVRGEGAVSFVLEGLRPGEILNPESDGAWRTIEERTDVRSGARVSGTVVIPQAPIGDLASLEWVQLRVRISRAVPDKAVEYDFSLAPIDSGSK